MARSRKKSSGHRIACNKKFTSGAKERRNIRKNLKLIFGGRCVLCGYDRTLNALEFHHIDPRTKKSSVSRAVQFAECWGDVFAEANKCVLLCANCHREVDSGLVTISAKLIKQQQHVVASNLARLAPRAIAG